MAFQILIVLSQLPLAIVCPSGLKATEKTGLECPERVLSSARFLSAIVGGGRGFETYKTVYAPNPSNKIVPPTSNGFFNLVFCFAEAIGGDGGG